jgi:hypothetical protein
MLAAAGVAGGETPEEPPSAVALANAPEVRQALSRIASGGYAEAVVRMMILLAQARGGVRRSRLVRSNALMQTEPPFSEMTASARQALIREQTVIASMAPAEALAALPKLLPDVADRRKAMATVEGVAGPEEELGEAAQAMLAQLRSALGLAAGLVPLSHEQAVVPD